jgi:hypothetical protein
MEHRRSEQFPTVLYKMFLGQVKWGVLVVGYRDNV